MQGLQSATGPVPVDLLLAMLLASVRAAGWLMLAPPFNSRAVNARVKAMLSVSLALPLAVRLRDQVPPVEPAAIITAVVQQAFIGIALGALCALVFAAVQAAGDLLDLFGGFQLASAYDPLMQSQTAIFGKLYGWTSSALLVFSGGHLIILAGFLRSYDVVGLDAVMSPAVVAGAFTQGIGQLMLAALQIAAPLVAVLFITDIGLGLLSRVAPALNVFAMSFPLKIIVTLTLGGFAYAMLPDVVTEMIGVARDLVVRAAAGGSALGGGS
ncbi:flagellar biosynthetic protein FliR [Kineococcus gynurae]|uniref:Flagellar biosynthetic protein FliR n=1 Tax=Kineococcus gynurae TaxID=452979 RepID=A0ABV5LR23_9ACTN